MGQDKTRPSWRNTGPTSTWTSNMTSWKWMDSLTCRSPDYAPEWNRHLIFLKVLFYLGCLCLKFQCNVLESYGNTLLINFGKGILFTMSYHVLSDHLYFDSVNKESFSWSQLTTLKWQQKEPPLGFARTSQGRDRRYHWLGWWIMDFSTQPPAWTGTHLLSSVSFGVGQLCQENIYM